MLQQSSELESMPNDFSSGTGQAPAATGPAPQQPYLSSSLTEEPGSQVKVAAHQQSSSGDASMTWPPKYAEADPIAFQPAQRRVPSQHAMTEMEQHGGAAAKRPAQQAPVQWAIGPEELSGQSAQHTEGGHSSQHSLSELEQQGGWAKRGTEQQGSTSQPQAMAPNSQERELIASQQDIGRSAPGRDSPTRDLTELEQQGNFTLTADQSRSQVGDLSGAEAAELAQDLARRKGAQAELERQYSQLQLQHQLVSCITVHACG